MKRAFSIAALGVAFLALTASAICFQVSYFFLTEPEPVKFYASIMRAEGKSLAAVVLPLMAASAVFAGAGVGLLWWPGRDPGLRKPVRWAGILLAVIWFVLCLNFLGFARVIPESILPKPGPGWVSTSSINVPMLLRFYFRMFRPGLGLAPIGQAIPWLVSIPAFPLLAFLVTANFSKTYERVKTAWKSLE